MRSKWRAAVVLVALSVGAAACGSTETSTPTLNSQATGADAGDSASDTDAGSADADSAESAAPATNLFPDTDVLNIADGSAVNLAAELGGGDKATLLWFFAPH